MNKEKSEDAQKFLDNIKNLEDISEVENMIKDNVIEFEIKQNKYRVRLPNFNEQKDLENFRRKKYVEFMQDDSMMFQKQWIEKYKSKGIDIEEMEQKIKNKERSIGKLKIQLAQTQNKEKVEDLKNQIITLKLEQGKINVERTDLLSFSIEDQLMIAVSSYSTYLVLEKLENKKDSSEKQRWVRVFKTYEEFDNSNDSVLLNKAFTYTTSIIYNSGI